MPPIFETLFNIAPYIIFLTILIFAGGLFSAPWYPTDRRYFTAIEKLASPKTNDIFYELGCGDGRLIA